jgi:molybdopterin converting factor small subunit
VRVTVTCFGAMREYLPEDADGNRATIELPDGASVGDLVDALGAPRRLVHALLVDEVQGAIGQRLHEGAAVTLMPPFSGGIED